MGIDIYLAWEGQTEADRKKMAAIGFSTTSGDVGYLREAYHGGPYATQILLREAFESEDCKAQIPAAVLRERLTNVTEPARGQTVGHAEPQTVEEAIYTRCKNLYPRDGVEYAEQVVQSFRDFVSLAERKERETGRPCTVYASH